MNLCQYEEQRKQAQLAELAEDRQAAREALEGMPGFRQAIEVYQRENRKADRIGQEFDEKGRDRWRTNSAYLAQLGRAMGQREVMAELLGAWLAENGRPNREGRGYLMIDRAAEIVHEEK